MFKSNWRIKFGLGLISLSAVLYLIHYFIFHDSHHIFIYLLGDIAFVPIEVLMVTIVIHELLSNKEKRSLLEKLNMIIGVFFSEVGRMLLVYFSDFDPKLANIREELMVDNDWSDKEFAVVEHRLKNYDFSVNVDHDRLLVLMEFLTKRRDFMLRLLENPNLLEHESFTELLRAVFHLTEELSSRHAIIELPDTDMEHLRVDINRAYVLLVKEWFSYMRYLKDNYPFLYSLAMRTNPFDDNATPIVSR